MSKEKKIDFERLRAPFPPEDVKWRVGQCGLKQSGEPWAKVLAYIDARAVTERLDEVCGPFGWQRTCRYIQAPAKSEDGKTIERDGFVCAIAIRDPSSGEWMTREDGAGLSDIEPFKGGISDSFKRAGAAWGIGAYLYKIEETWAECSKHTNAYPNFGSGFDKRSKQRFQFSWKSPEIEGVSSAPQNGNGQGYEEREREAIKERYKSSFAGGGDHPSRREEELSLEGHTAPLTFPGADVPSIADLQAQYTDLAKRLYQNGFDVREKGYGQGDSMRLGAVVLEERIVQMKQWLREVV